MRPILPILFLIATSLAHADTWVDRAPVVSVRPLYATSPSCHPDAARRLARAGIVAALRQDLALARCEADAREISGWHVVYRYRGRDYERIMPRHPGRYVEVEVEVHANAR